MKISKIPMWPLYVADALMFITVFAIALPSIRYAEEMGLGVAFFCCLMVLGAMAMLLVPYWLEYKKDLASKAEHTEEAAENFKIIFDQLSELQLMIADVEEKREKNEFSLEELKGGSDASSIIKAVSEFKDAVKTKFKESSAANAENAERIAALKDEIDAKMSEIGNILNELSRASKEASIQAEENDKTLAAAVSDMEVVKDMLSAVNESLGDEISQLRAQMLQFCNPGDNQPESATDSADKSAPPKLGNLLQKALGQAEDTKMSVSKLVSIGTEKPNFSNEDNLNGLQEPEEQEPEESKNLSDIPGGEGNTQPARDLEGAKSNGGAEETSLDEGESTQAFQNSQAPEQAGESSLSRGDNSAEPDSSAPSAGEGETDAHIGEDDFSFDDSPGENTNSSQKQKNGGFDDDIDFFEPADSAATKSESANMQQHTEKSAPAEKEISEMLFDSLPESPSKPKKPAKEDSVVVVNSLIGIGNKPYIRGNAAGLSPEKGVAMEYLEIGKWRYVAKGLSEPLKFSVFKNDSQPPLGENSFTLEAGQKLEIDLSFPQEQ